jgi:hypothetical protein
MAEKTDKVRRFAMPENFTFRFTPTKDDFTQTIRAYTLRQTSTRIALILVAVVVIFETISAIALGIDWSTVNYYLPLNVFLVAYVVFLLLINPWLVGRQVPKNERLSSEITWEVDEDEIRVSNKFMQSKFDWGTFHSAIETRTHYLLILSSNKRMYQVLPKRAFETPAQEAAFRTLLKTKQIKGLNS